MSYISRTVVHATIVVAFLFTALVPAPLMAQIPETDSRIASADHAGASTTDAVTVARAEFHPIMNSWKRHSIELSYTNFKTPDGGYIGEEQFRTLMSNVTQIRISTEYHHGPDIGSLDSISIGSRYNEEFTIGANGWTVRNDGTLKWIRTGGDPGGYAQVDDWTTGQLNWLVAPPSWSGDWRDLIGKNLRLSSNTDESISYPGRVEIVSEPSNTERRLVLEPDDWTIRPGEKTAVWVTALPNADADTSVSYMSSDPSCFSVSWTTSKIIKGGDSTWVSAQAQPTTGNGCSSTIEAKADGYVSSRVTLVNFPVQEGNIILNADGPGVKVNGQSVPMGNSVKIGDASRIESSQEGGFSIDAQCEKALFFLLYFIISSAEGEGEGNAPLALAFYTSTEWIQFVKEECGQRTISDARDIQPTTAAHLQLVLAEGGGRIGTNADLVLDVKTPNGICQSSGKSEFEAQYSPSSDISYFSLASGSITVTPSNTKIASYTLAEGEEILLTDSDMQTIEPTVFIYLPLCVR